MAKIQRHHITYEPEWVVELGMQMHRCISRVQVTKATPQQYADLTNFKHAVDYEWNRMRQELDTKLDLRVRKGTRGKKKVVTTKPKRQIKRR